MSGAKCGFLIPDFAALIRATEIMIVQACINGNRDRAFHPALPVTLDEIVRDARAVVAAGAAEVHLHVRDDAGRETLRPDVVEATIDAVRRACPGTLIGISTGEWIERNDARRRDYLRALSAVPDHASVNYADADAPGVVAAMRERGIGVEAGLATVADANRLVEMGIGGVLRILIELDNQLLIGGSLERVQIVDPQSELAGRSQRFGGGLPLAKARMGQGQVKLAIRSRLLADRFSEIGKGLLQLARGEVGRPTRIEQCRQRSGNRDRLFDQCQRLLGLLSL